MELTDGALDPQPVNLCQRVQLPEVLHNLLVQLLDPQPLILLLLRLLGFLLLCWELLLGGARGGDPRHSERLPEGLRGLLI